MLEKASDYIPLAKKAAYARAVAEYCICDLTPPLYSANSAGAFPIPAVKAEETIEKRLYILMFFLREYLHIELEGETFTADDFDRYSSAHLFNQLERFKSTDLKDKVFDILADFKDFKAILEAEIANQKARYNDAAERIQAAITVSTDPEQLKKAYGAIDYKPAKIINRTSAILDGTDTQTLVSRLSSLKSGESLINTNN